MKIPCQKLKGLFFLLIYTWSVVIQQPRRGNHHRISFQYDDVAIVPTTTIHQISDSHHWYLTTMSCIWRLTFDNNFIQEVMNLTLVNRTFDTQIYKNLPDIRCKAIDIPTGFQTRVIKSMTRDVVNSKKYSYKTSQK